MIRGLEPIGDEDDGHPKLWQVSVTREVEAEVYVWAEDAEQAERIAENEAEIDDLDGYTTATARRVIAKDLKARDGRLMLASGWDEADCPYGDPPDGVGHTIADAVRWQRRTELAIKAYAEAQKNQPPLFEGVAPIPLPCSECGHRYPAEMHAEDCSNREA